MNTSLVRSAFSVCAAAATLATLSVPAGAAVERVFVLVHNDSSHIAHVQVIGADRRIEEFRLKAGEGSQRLIDLDSPATIHLWSACAKMDPISDRARVDRKGTTLMIYVRANCSLQVQTHVKG